MTARILGLDPSIENTGAALIADNNARNPNVGTVAGLWRIRPEGKALADKVLSLGRQIEGLLKELRPEMVVVEMPADPKRGGRGAYRGRSVMTAPVYGAAVGAAVYAVRIFSPAPSLLFPSVNDWTGRDVPSSKNDPDKEARVRWACHLWGLETGRLGPRSSAGNLADALFIARWGLWRWQSQQGRKAGAA